MVYDFLVCLRNNGHEGNIIQIKNEGDGWGGNECLPNFGIGKFTSGVGLAELRATYEETHKVDADMLAALKISGSETITTDDLEER